MNEKRRTQIISYLLTASLLLSFWVCVENCPAVEMNCETLFSVSDNLQVENTDEDFCSIQTAPSAIFPNQKLFASTNFVSLPNQSHKLIFQPVSTSVVSYRNRNMFVRLPLQILRQLRI